MKKEEMNCKMKINFQHQPRYDQYSKSLYLEQCGPQWVQYLSQKDYTTLSKLSLAFSSITPSNLSNLSQYDWKNLKILLLSFNPIRSSGLKLLIKIDLHSLQQISLRGCMIGNEGAKHIAKANWPNINKLSVRTNFVELDGYISISQNAWNKIQMLQIEQYKQKTYSFNDYMAVSNLIVLQPSNNRVSKVFQNWIFIYGIRRLLQSRSIYQPLYGRYYIRT